MNLLQQYSLTAKEPGSSIYEQGLEQDKTTVEVKQESNSGSTWANLGISILPVLIITVVLFFYAKEAQGQGNQAMRAFGKSKARLYGNEKDKVIFKDIAGTEEAKEDSEGCRIFEVSQKVRTVALRFQKVFYWLGLQEQEKPC